MRHVEFSALFRVCLVLRICGLIGTCIADADPLISNHALRIVSQYKGTFTSAPTLSNTDQTTDAPLLGNGDVGVAIIGSIDTMTFVVGKNEFWSLADRSVRAMARISLAVPGMAGASYSMIENIATGEVNGSFLLNSTTITTKTWVQANNTAENILVSNFTYTGSGTRSMAVSLSSGIDNSYPNSVGSSADVLFLDVRADNGDMAGSYATRKARIATRVIGTIGTVANNKLTFTMSPGNTYSLVTGIMSNYDNADYQNLAIGTVASRTTAGIDSLNALHRIWWNNFYGKSFVEIPNKTLEKEFYGSLYLLACCSRTNEAAPGLWGNWIMRNPAWSGDYTLNYNYEVPFYMAFPTNHPELADCYDKSVIDWVPKAQAEAAASGWTGAFYRVHIGPLPNGSGDQNTWNQKSCGAYAATDMIMHYYYTRDLTYANSIYNTLKQIAIFWQDYLHWDGTRYVILNDAQHEGDASPQTNGVMALGLVRFLMQACIDISSDLNVDPSFRSTWQDRLSKLSSFPTFTRNNQTVFRYTEAGLEWNNGNAIGIQHIYPGSQIGLGSDSTLLAIGKTMVGQMARWSDGNGTNTFYPAAARVGYNPATILTQLNSWVSNNTYPNLHIHTGGGGIENLNTVPATLCEMLVQSFQNKIRLFANWPQNTYAKFGDLAAYGGFLVSSDIENNIVQYMRVQSNAGRSLTFVNPWPGQTLRLYRNGNDSGTLTGSEITISTSLSETTHLAVNGTPLSVILARMAAPGGTVVGVSNNPLQPQTGASFSTERKLFSRTRDKAITFSATNTDNGAKRMTVDVYTLDGTLVAEMSSNGNVVRWNMKCSGNVSAAPGVYIYRIKMDLANKATLVSGIFQIVQ
jgi:alpha-L-fucosidase 2